MPNFQPPIRRRNHGKGHSYRDVNGHKVPGVTTLISNGFPAPALINWSATATIDYALDFWDELDELKPSERRKRLQHARFADRDAAANKGTKVHGLAERLVSGETIDVPDELAGYVDAYIRFLDEWHAQPVLVEGVIVSQHHGYAGTLDLIADLVDETDSTKTQRWLLDIKTSRSGVFPNHVLQLAAYRYADTVLWRDGTETVVPEVDRVGVVHVREDGYELVPVDATPDVFRTFLYVQQIAAYVDTGREFIDQPITPPEPNEANE